MAKSSGYGKTSRMIFAILAAAALCVALAGCGSSSDESADVADDTTTESAPAPEANPGISDDWTTVTGYGWTADIPETWQGVVGAEVDDELQAVSFYVTQEQQNGNGGFLMGLVICDSADPGYPSFDMVHDFGDGTYLIAEYPSDVQFDPQNPDVYQECNDAKDDLIASLKF